jgi:hypothetical protein
LDVDSLPVKVFCDTKGFTIDIWSVHSQEEKIPITKNYNCNNNDTDETECESYECPGIAHKATKRSRTQSVARYELHYSWGSEWSNHWADSEPRGGDKWKREYKTQNDTREENAELGEVPMDEVTKEKPNIVSDEWEWIPVIPKHERFGK